ncbi:MAG: metal-dependent hydrolase [Oscillatoriales cyanobacterium RM2_1_1]|nr:metal-dependent hydrolase [Oscillatoriales cyanobacterium SM2_3_0]NJO46587.1 metal-dependent hydrolase [Oscillatoriales cyanobacterium RM2_1_1]
MPSPVGHTIAGLCGFILAQPTGLKSQRWPLLLLLTLSANLPDIDIPWGLLIAGDPFIYHRQATHSIAAALLIGGLTYGLVTLLGTRLKTRGRKVGVWVMGLYLSHIILDMLVSDLYPPAGVQALWPLSQDYLISPVTIFGGLHLSDSGQGLLRAILSQENLLTILQEIVILLPVTGLAWQVTRRSRPQKQS